MPAVELQKGRIAIGLTHDGRLKSGKLAGLSMGGAIWVLSWPVLVESFLNSLVGLTDTVLAAALVDGEAATDAIGGASYIMWFIGLTIMAIGIGATALISRAVGGGKFAVANAALGQTILMAVFLGVLVGFGVATMASPVAQLLNMSDAATQAFDVYMSTVAMGVPFTAVLFAGIACARGAGDSIRPLHAMFVVNIVNVCLSFALAGVDITRTSIDPVTGERLSRIVLANPFGFDLGVQGIAIGTVAAHGVGAVIILVMAARGTWGIRLMRRRLRPHWHTMRRLIRIGFPNFCETFGLWIGNFLLILLVGLLGHGQLGAHVVAIRIEAFSFLPGFAVGAAAATLAGQYLGAGSPEKAKRAVFYCALMASVVMGLCGAAFVAWSRPIVGLLTQQPVHLEIAPQLILLAGFVQAPFAFAIVTRQAMRGAGDVRFVMWLTWTTTYVVRLPLAYALSGIDIPAPAWMGGGVIENPFRDEPSLAGLWLGLCIELGIRGMLFGARYLHGGWLKARV